MPVTTEPKFSNPWAATAEATTPSAHGLQKEKAPQGDDRVPQLEQPPCPPQARERLPAATKA